MYGSIFLFDVVFKSIRNLIFFFSPYTIGLTNFRDAKVYEVICLKQELEIRMPFFFFWICF